LSQIYGKTEEKDPQVLKILYLQVVHPIQMKSKFDVCIEV